MVLLKKTLAPVSTVVALSILAAGCGTSTTLVSYVDTDTYISSTDASNHSELPYDRVSNTTGGTEERTLLKLPTGQEDQNYNLDQVFGNLNNPLTWPLLPFVIVMDIFEAFFNCTTAILSPSNLTSAFLVLNVNSNVGSAALSQITIQHVAKPWWQTVSWTQAFPFSGAGNWSQGGGDLDPTFTPIAGATPDSGVTIQFDVTAYLKQLMTNQNQPHYGFVMRAAGGVALSQVVLDSVQYTDMSVRPRLVSTYTCQAPTNTELQPQPEPKPYTYILGQRH